MRALDLPRWKYCPSSVRARDIFGVSCTLFRPAATDSGICHGFNINRFVLRQKHVKVVFTLLSASRSLLKESAFTKAVRGAYRTKVGRKQDEEEEEEEEGLARLGEKFKSILDVVDFSILLRSLEHGYDQGLSFVVDLRSSSPLRSEWIDASDSLARGAFEVAVDGQVRT